MFKKTAFAVTLSLLICAPAVAYPIAGSAYDADEVVPLPVPPSTEYTNQTSGRIDALNYNEGNPLDYTIVVQNEFSLERWKEFLYELTNIQCNPADCFMDFHVDFSSTNPAWLVDQGEPRFLCEAYWNTLYAGSGALPPMTWTVVGYPGDNAQAPLSPVLSLAGQVDYYMDLQLPPYDKTTYYDWNPEWVSLSFYGWGFALDYRFTDWCIPEPATLTLVGLGAALLLKRRRA